MEKTKKEPDRLAGEDEQSGPAKTETTSGVARNTGLSAQVNGTAQDTNVIQIGEAVERLLRRL